MKQQTSRVLESVIGALDKEVPPEWQRDSCRSEAEQLRPDDEEGLNRHLLLLNAILASAKGVEDAVARRLIGENILTPSLSTRGWMFWRQPLLSGSEGTAVEAAVVRCAEEQARQAKSIADAFGKLPPKDLRAQAVALAAVVDVTLASIQQLSADLKEILRRRGTQ